MSFETALTAARYFGAEAAANGQTSMNKDDRMDLALEYGVEDWSCIPKEHQDKLLEKFQVGRRAELEHYSKWIPNKE